MARLRIAPLFGEDDEPDFRRGIAKEFERRHGRRPLMYDPDGDNSGLLAELQRQYERKDSIIKTTRRSKPLEGPVPIALLLPPAEQALMVERIAARFQAEESRRQARRAKHKPRYKRAVQSAIEEALNDKGLKTTARELWQLMGTTLCRGTCGGDEYELRSDPTQDCLEVYPPSPTAPCKLIAWKTFQSYVTEVKKELRRELRLAAPPTPAEVEEADLLAASFLKLAPLLAKLMRNRPLPESQ